MPGKQAKIVTPPMLKRMLQSASRSAFPARGRAMILLSVKAGLRAGEIAKLDWSMVLDAQGKVANSIAIRDAIAKKRSGRRPAARPQGCLQTVRSSASCQTDRRRPYRFDRRYIRCWSVPT